MDNNTRGGPGSTHVPTAQEGKLSLREGKPHVLALSAKLAAGWDVNSGALDVNGQGHGPCPSHVKERDGVPGSRPRGWTRSQTDGIRIVGFIALLIL